jgi:hypothetical protein
MHTITYKFIGLKGKLLQDRFKALLTDMCGKISGFSRVEKNIPIVASVENSDTLLGIVAVPDYAIISSYVHSDDYLELNIYSARGIRDSELRFFLELNFPARIIEQTYRNI